MNGQQGGQGGGILGEFEQFLAWKQQQQAAQQDDGAEVPVFEKLKDGTERSATIPWRHARGLLEQWGWVQAEGDDSGDGDQGQAGQDGGQARKFFQSLAGGQASGPQPKASGGRAPRQGTG